ncbi:hypothetical protein Dsin_024909 [Dipteronia sinensis]|uniref:Retrotransposon gag domain-containing protein n=1 Tax=Dipteronia sinensis TaxID=43782 RepID=A0AAD9ZV54_9ROSI|nr:hypothetical protein Dsin_024909 [Dipteronia sinensis]
MVLNVVDDDGHQRDLDEINSRAEGGNADNPSRERRRRHQHITQFVDRRTHEPSGTTKSYGKPTRRNTRSIYIGHCYSSGHRESPYMEKITSISFSTDIKLQCKDICGFSGTGDPKDHLDTYLDWMNMQGASNTVKCRVFPLTLSKDAQTWYNGLKRQSISSFHELPEEFSNGFAASRRRRSYMIHLNSIKQVDFKTIRDYMKRINEDERQVQDFNEIRVCLQPGTSSRSPELVTVQKRTIYIPGAHGKS